MISRRAVLATALLAGALSCSEATSPSHVPLYEWRLVVDTDTLSFHWPTSSLPVKIWVEDSLDMPAHVQDGIDTWASSFLYGEYAAVLVADSGAADLIVRVALAPPKAASNVGRLHTLFDGCEGATDIDTVATRFQLKMPVRMYVTPRYDPATTDLSECFRVTALHELGHSLGIFRHSGSPDDIMWGNPVGPGLSVRDINTAQALSHYPANMTPTR
ncbi:MAG TPA: hypothetical protein VFV65_07880 [Gemmatimonadales bacterium]|nr:hypothetical protein [Gemmatimonadales bacterium]